MSDKIKEIRARHERVRRDGDLAMPPVSMAGQNAAVDAHDDRATLLAEVDRLRADLATQQGCCDGAAAQDAHVRREREEHLAEIEKLRAEIKRLHQAHQAACEGGDLLREKIERLRAENEMLIVEVTMIERMAAGAIYSQESIHAAAIGVLKQLRGKP